MCRACALAVLFPAVWLTAPAAAQPDRTAALERAKAKFEADVSKAEEALVASIDKALKSATSAGNKALVDKLTYERGVFVKHRLTPTAVPQAGAYVKQRGASIAALENSYRPAIKELIRAKKDDEAGALETALNNMVKSARGYGLALPDLDGRPVVYIENKGLGLVLEVKERYGEVTAGTKAAPARKNQLWQLEREEKGFVFRNLDSKDLMYPSLRADGSGGTRHMFGMTSPDPKRETPERVLFDVTDVRHEVVITSLGRDFGNRTNNTLTVTERKLKGVTVHDVLAEKKDSPPSAGQLWTITVAK